jgi:colanic acid/amylovoran biosynthesis glycosyltransferase
MKIAIISSSYPFGHSESFLANEVEYLSRFMDIDVYPVKLKNPDDKCRPIPENLVFFQPFISENRLNRWFNRGLISEFALHYFAELPKLFLQSTNFRASLKDWGIQFLSHSKVFSSKRFRELMDSNEYDLVYFYWGTFPMALINCSKRCFIRVHGGEIDLERSFGFIPLFSSRFFNNERTVYLPISQVVSDKLTELNVSRKVLSRIGVFDHGLGPVPTIDSDICVVSCSNLIKLKRVELICHALSLIHDRRIRWIHFGDGPTRADVESAARSLSSNISFTIKGRVPNTEIIEFFKSYPVDLFINVSTHEGVPVSVMEALSFGVPCAATDVGATSEIVDQSVGYLLPKDFNPSQLANIIANVRKENTTSSVRENARDRWKKLCNAEMNFEKLLLEFNKTNQKV